MTNAVKIIECPRDAWQGLPNQISPEVKEDYLRKLIEAGFKHIDAVSFVSPAAVPQMADSEQVLSHLSLPSDVEIVGIVVNEKGAQRALVNDAVTTLGFPYSISAEFLRRNQHQTLEQALDTLQAIYSLAEGQGRNVVAYVSMAFGNPYNDPWHIDELLDACDLIAECGVSQISLADTVGLAKPDQIQYVLSRVISEYQGIEIGAHLHARPDAAAERVRAAYEAGCRRFDSAIGGLGGCPFAQDILVGNLPTEILVEELGRCGAAVPDLRGIDDLVAASCEISTRFGAPVQ
ncbi:hydroxymethylglutaryl-CoA lyase [Occallatibacter savannae]|uniref:hydroxymethylglutaryl-CoA lyase n=1 Tax=Occallatibacter savannae TaxID=1002691 RepID=UPI000D69D47C|nr:hydroxymethylglutaryl-CoA lyase [Occallatibacter savannae]